MDPMTTTKQKTADGSKTNGAATASEVPSWVGEADAKILEWKHDKVNDKPCIRVMFGIMSGPLRGRRVDWCAWLTPAAIDNALKQLEAGGYRGGSLRSLDGFGTCIVSVRIEAEAGSGSNARSVFPKVGWVNKIKTLDKAKGLDDEELAALDELVAKRSAK